MVNIGNDFKAILSQAGKTLTLRRVTFSEDPVYGEGTASYVDVSVLGFLDSYDVGREMLGLGDIGVGKSRVFLETIATPAVNDLVVDGSTTYKINRVDSFRFGSEDVYLCVDVSLESG